MFGSIFGVYRLLIASTMALCGHGRHVLIFIKNPKDFVPIFVPSADSYVGEDSLLSLFPPQLQFWAQKDALHDGLSSYASSAAHKSNIATII